MSEELTDIIVGSGVAAHAFLWTYARNLQNNNLDLPRRIVWIKSPVLPTCSLTSTSIVSKAGLQRNTSPFGDQLIDSYELFNNHFKDFDSVEVAAQTHLLHGDPEQFNKRYSDAPSTCLIVQSEHFLKELEEEFLQVFSSNIEIVFDTIICEKSHSVQLQSREINFSRLFLFLGGGNKLYDKDPGGRAVVGQYAQTHIDLGDKGFVQSKGPHNLIYRSIDKKLLLGSLDDKADELGWPVLAPRTHAIKVFLKDFDIKLPNDLQWEVYSGVRHKGVKRLPFWGEVRPKVYSVHGLYKNGYTLSFLAAQQFLRL